MIEFINKHWIVFNPITVLAYAVVALDIVFWLLGWSE